MENIMGKKKEKKMINSIFPLHNFIKVFFHGVIERFDYVYRHFVNKDINYVTSKGFIGHVKYLTNNLLFFTSLEEKI